MYFSIAYGGKASFFNRLVLQGLKAIYSPETGIVDYLEVTKSYASNFEQQNGSIFCNFKAKKFSESDDPEFPITIVS